VAVQVVPQFGEFGRPSSKSPHQCVWRQPGVALADRLSVTFKLIYFQWRFLCLFDLDHTPQQRSTSAASKSKQIFGIVHPGDKLNIDTQTEFCDLLMYVAQSRVVLKGKTHRVKNRYLLASLATWLVPAQNLPQIYHGEVVI
jgi:hypothetical protein